MDQAIYCVDNINLSTLIILAVMLSISSIQPQPNQET